MRKEKKFSTPIIIQLPFLFIIKFDKLNHIHIGIFLNQQL